MDAVLPPSQMVFLLIDFLSHLSPLMRLGTRMMKGLLVTVVTLMCVPLRLIWPSAMGRSRRRNIGQCIILERNPIRSQIQQTLMWVPLRLFCPNAIGSSRGRNIGRGINLKSGI